MTAYGLIDTTEMYLRTVFELEEEGVVPLRARIAERLHQSGPTVSQTVARMERDGLLAVTVDRHLQLTSEGYTLAMRVMRKHRLAECLLVDVIGLDWEQVHVEACRWEHVMSEDVEQRLVQLLKHPDVCPHGNPIPGLAELGEPPADADSVQPSLELTAMTDLASDGGRAGVVSRISEHIQSDIGLMAVLKRAGVRPGREIKVVSSVDGVRVSSDADDEPVATEIPHGIAGHVFVTPC